MLMLTDGFPTVHNREDQDMPDYPNIEKSGFRKGVYVGYCSRPNYGAWTITKIKSACGLWQARHGTHLLFADTLADMSKKLEALSTPIDRSGRPLIQA
jgi:hypothetical protein